MRGRGAGREGGGGGREGGRHHWSHAIHRQAWFAQFPFGVELRRAGENRCHGGETPGPTRVGLIAMEVLGGRGLEGEWFQLARVPPAAVAHGGGRKGGR